MKPTTYRNPDHKPVEPYTFPLGVAKTFFLLGEAVTHWKAICANPLFEPVGGSSCAFCVEAQVGPGNCTICPIASFGYRGCTGSPYTLFIDYRIDCRSRIKAKRFKPSNMKRLIRLADNELRFLDFYLRTYLEWSAKQFKRPDLKPGDVIQVWQSTNPKNRYLRRFSHWSAKHGKVWCYTDGDYPNSGLSLDGVLWNYYSLLDEKEKEEA